MMVLKAFWGSLEVIVGALAGVLEGLWVVLGVSWESLEGLLEVSRDLLSNLRSTKKFVLEFLMASVDLDVLFFFLPKVLQV